MIPPNPSLQQLNALNKETLMGTLGMEYLDAQPGFVYARMPVDARTRQPAGILHGGASLAMAETLGGLGSLLLIDAAQSDVRGAHISGNHVFPGKGQWVYGKATLIHQGKNTHLWNIDVFDENEQLLSTIRLTNFIVPKNNPTNR